MRGVVLVKSGKWSGWGAWCGVCERRNVVWVGCVVCCSLKCGMGSGWGMGVALVKCSVLGVGVVLVKCGEGGVLVVVLVKCRKWSVRVEGCGAFEVWNGQWVRYEGWCL